MTPWRSPGPLRLGLAIAALAAFGFFGVLLARLNGRLATQERANRQSLAASGSIVAVNARIAGRLDQLSAVTVLAGEVLESLRDLTPQLEDLRTGVSAAGRSVTAGRAGGEASRASLEEIDRLLEALEARLSAEASSSRRLGAQTGALGATIREMVADLEAALADARRIRRGLAPEPGLLP